jgi:hypothetical protein
LAPLPALADAPNFQYQYLEVGHQHIGLEGSPSGTGSYIDLAYTVVDSVQFRASYASISYPGGVSYKDYSAGFTGEDPLSDSTDVFTDVLYVNDRYDYLGKYVSDDGYRLAIGIRQRPWKLQGLDLEGWLARNFLGATTVPGAGSQQTYLPQASNEIGVGALYDVTHWLALGLRFTHDSQYTNTTSLRVRFYF